MSSGDIYRVRRVKRVLGVPADGNDRYSNVMRTKIGRETGRDIAVPSQTQQWRGCGSQRDIKGGVGQAQAQTWEGQRLDHERRHRPEFGSRRSSESNPLELTNLKSQVPRPRRRFVRQFW